MFKKLKVPDLGSDQIQVLSLSLFMLLLAFFIVLSTLIEFDKDKLQSLKNGIEEAFLKGAILERGASEEDRKGDNVGTGIENTFTEVEELLRINIGVLGLQKVDNTGTMVVTVPADELFELKKETLYQIASILRSAENKTVRYELEALAGIDEKVSQADVKILQEKTRKLGAFARAMVQQGLPNHKLSIGIINSRSTIVDLIFYAKRQDKPFIKLNPAEINRGFGGGT